VEVVPTRQSVAAMFEVVLSNGRMLRVPADAEAETVARLAGALEG
jgi:hypothetical protein